MSEILSFSLSLLACRLSEGSSLKYMLNSELSSLGMKSPPTNLASPNEQTTTTSVMAKNMSLNLSAKVKSFS